MEGVLRISLILSFLLVLFFLIRNSKVETSNDFGLDPEDWGEYEEEQADESNRLSLTFSSFNNDGRHVLYYTIIGFDHIESRTLSREVIEEMSKSIICIEFYLTYADTLRDDVPFVSPDDVELIQLLADLDAPVKILELTNDFYSDYYAEARKKFLPLFQSFTTLKMDYYSRDTQLLADTISEPMLRSSTISCRSLSDPNDFWVEYSSSDGLTNIAAGFRNFGMALEVIDRWKKMDPRTLPYCKLFCGLKSSSVTRTGEGMQEVDMEAEAALVEKVESELDDGNLIKSLYLIDHPVDLNSKIYVAFYDEVNRYSNKDGETILLFE
uniref:Uncharacterized protein n=1 Tax=Steinernema glaseri TaxID=37863 RepID=A0A1I7YCZ5_9BILA